MSSQLPVQRVVLYKHGVGYFEREGSVSGDVALSLTFKQSDVSDVLKSLTILDLDGGHIASVSYDSTKPLEQLLTEIALDIPDEGSLVGLLPQIKGARIAVTPSGAEACEGILLGIDTTEVHSADGIVRVVKLAMLGDAGQVQQFELSDLRRLELLDATLRRDLEFYLKTQLSAKKKDARTFTFFAKGEGARRIRLSYTLGAPVWKATYRVLLGEEGQPLIQGWAVVDNMQDEDWDGVTLSLVAGLPVSFLHDLYTPRYVRRPVVEVQETTGVLPPTVEDGMEMHAGGGGYGGGATLMSASAPMPQAKSGPGRVRGVNRVDLAATSTPAQVRERKLGDLFEYAIEHPVTIQRNQSALVPIVLKRFDGRSVLLHNRATRPNNPMRCVEFKNTTGLTLEGGPVTVLDKDSYVGEAMLETTKPDQLRLLPYAVELSVAVLDNVDSYNEKTYRVILRDGRLTRISRNIWQTTYHFDNRSEQQHVLYLDHERDSRWSLFATDEPHETTESHWRFRFPLPAKTLTKFAVKQQQAIERVNALASMDLQELTFWIDEKHLDANTQEALQQIVTTRRRIAELDAVLVALQEERNRIALEQSRIRENLAALGERASEKDLRERYVRALNAQEDRLEQVNAQFEQSSKEKDAIREQMNQLADRLEFAGEVK